MTSVSVCSVLFVDVFDLILFKVYISFIASKFKSTFFFFAEEIHRLKKNHHKIKMYSSSLQNKSVVNICDIPCSHIVTGWLIIDKVIGKFTLSPEDILAHYTDAF